MRKVKTTPLAIRMSQTSDRRKYRSGCFIGPRPSRKVHLVFSRPKSLELVQSQIGPSATALALGPFLLTNPATTYFYRSRSSYLPPQRGSPRFTKVPS